MARSIRRQRREATVPVESFADLAFLLIIFFIVVTTLEVSRGFQADLPSSQRSEKSTEEKAPIIQIKDDDPGRFYFSDAPVTLEELKVRLARLRLPEREGDQRIVLLEATGAVAYEKYFQAMAAISQAGGTVGIVREQEQ